MRPVSMLNTYSAASNLRTSLKSLPLLNEYFIDFLTLINQNVRIHSLKNITVLTFCIYLVFVLYYYNFVL